MTTLGASPHEFHVPADFAFFSGGPFRNFWMRARGLLRFHAFEEGKALFSVAGCAAITWAPILLLTIVHGDFWSARYVPFIRDIDAHARFLLALPLLLTGSQIADRVLPLVLESFVNKDIVADGDRAKFEAIVRDAASWNRSRALFAAVLGLVLVTGRIAWRHQLAGRGDSWYGVLDGGAFHLSLAGHWYALISIPLFQFVLYRWYLRLILWWAVLVRVSRLDLRLIAADPDRAGGLGFLPDRIYAFTPFLFAHGILVFGFVANNIFNEGRHFPEYYHAVGGATAVMLILVLGPMTAFIGPLIRARRTGRDEFGVFASRYVEDFNRKWIQSASPPEEPLLGTADLQSLADLANADKVVDEMRPVPFKRNTVIAVVLAFLLPILPLALTVLPLSAMMRQLVKVLV